MTTETYAPRLTLFCLMGIFAFSAGPGQSSPSYAAVQTDPLSTLSHSNIPGLSAGQVKTTLPSTQGAGNADAQTDKRLQIAFDDGLTNGIVSTIGEVERVCASVPAEYRISCLGEGFKWAARQMPSNPDYREARAAVSKAGSRLQKIAKSNADRKAPVHSTAKARKWKGKKKFTAVQKAKLKTATTAASAVIKETETRLLRSAENSQRRRVHYQKIASSVGSTRRILRS